MLGNRVGHFVKQESFMNFNPSHAVQLAHRETPTPLDGQAATISAKPGKLLRLPRVIEATGFGKSSIYAGVKTGDFPAPVRLSARAVGWRESDIERWISERVKTGCAA